MTESLALYTCYGATDITLLTLCSSKTTRSGRVCIRLTPYHAHFEVVTYLNLYKNQQKVATGAGQWN